MVGFVLFGAALFLGGLAVLVVLAAHGPGDGAGRRPGGLHRSHRRRSRPAAAPAASVPAARPPGPPAPGLPSVRPAVPRPPSVRPAVPRPPSVRVKAGPPVPGPRAAPRPPRPAAPVRVTADGPRPVGTAAASP